MALTLHRSRWEPAGQGRAGRGLAGYTMIELLVVLGVLGALSCLVFPLAELTVQRDRETELRRALWEIRDAIDAYHKAQLDGRMAVLATPSGYPPTLRTLSDGVLDKKTGERMFFLRRVPRDPFADPELPAERTWGLRSYLSGAEKPEVGDDVYDVYSTSVRVGLNGVALREW